MNRRDILSPAMNVTRTEKIMSKSLRVWIVITIIWVVAWRVVADRDFDRMDEIPLLIIFGVPALGWMIYWIKDAATLKH